jgi:hypothetical protein
VLAFFTGGELTPEKLTIPTLVAALTGLGKLLVDTLLTPLGGWVTVLFDDGAGYGGESDLVRDIQRDLEMLNGVLLDADERVLIVVDDLDRCEPQKTIEVLQSINLLLNQERFVVCLGIDARVVTAAVEKHYEDLLGPAGVTGYEYLDKIIQIPFRIPDPTDRELMQFVSLQLGDPKPPPATRPTRDAPPSPGGASAPDLLRAMGAAAAQRGPLERLAQSGAVPDVAPSPVTPRATPRSASRAPSSAPPREASKRDPFREPNAAGEPPTFRHAELVAFEEVAPLLRPNPRHVKRLVNVYALVRSLAELGKSSVILADPAATVRWLTLCAQWPYAARRMLDHLDAYGPPDPAIDPAGAALPPLRWLLDAVAPSLDAAKQARYDHDPRLLERLVASSEGLSWDELRALRAHTVNFNPALDAELRAEPAPPTRRRAAPPSYDRRSSARDGRRPNAPPA